VLAAEEARPEEVSANCRLSRKVSWFWTFVSFLDERENFPVPAMQISSISFAGAAGPPAR
jgi:hypothetical protein